MKEQDRILAAFRGGDTEQDGRIARAQLDAVFHRLGLKGEELEGLSRLLDSRTEASTASVDYVDFLDWIFAPADVAEAPPPEPPAAPGCERHLVLHFDVNKTIVMVDSATKKSIRDVAHEVFARVSWGTVEPAGDDRGDGTGPPAVWRCASDCPCVGRPSQGLVSYAEFLLKHCPSEHWQERCSVFTKPGEPGEPLRRPYEEFVSGLSLPAELVGSEAAQAVGLTGTHLFIIPAFFELLLHLKRAGRSFSLVFRTFGTDLKDVVAEFNGFCEGKHPLFPNAVFDGRDGWTDYRVSFGDPSTFGTFFRSTDGIALVLGTLEQPALERGLGFYQDRERFPALGAPAVGLRDVHQKLQGLTQKPGTLALRDYFPYWRAQGKGDDPRRANCGKLLFLDPTEAAHHVFFDDHVCSDNAKIVDVRYVSMPEKVPWVQYVLQCHIVRAEPLESVRDRSYFIRHVERLSAAYEDRLRANGRMRSLLQQSARRGNFAGILRELLANMPGNQPSYDAWASIRGRAIQHSTDNLFDDCPDALVRAGLT